MAGKWNETEKQELAKAFKILTIIQKNYGRDINPIETLRAWEFILSEKYTAEQVLLAMRSYMELSSDMPSPSDLIKIISPPPKKITYAEYKHALEQHALEGYPMFGYFGQVIKDFEKQGGDESGVKSQYEILESRKNAETIPQVKSILALTYGEGGENDD